MRKASPPSSKSANRYSKGSSGLARSGGFSRDTDLTGVWSGEYWYDAGAGLRTGFAAHLIETAGSLEGTTLERVGGAGELSACLVGSHDGADVAFTKVYD